MSTLTAEPHNICRVSKETLFACRVEGHRHWKKSSSTTHSQVRSINEKSSRQLEVVQYQRHSAH
ncbi:hypothetical protein Vi05172_g6981 [Venturia inaequalis]|nr:hypothetical protein Vi05172_g6981 [Venturia inaequalis]